MPPEGRCEGDGQDELDGTCLEEKDDESDDDEGDYE